METMVQCDHCDVAMKVSDMKCRWCGATTKMQVLFGTSHVSRCPTRDCEYNVRVDDMVKHMIQGNKASK